MRKILIKHIGTPQTPAALVHTIKLIGKSILDGSIYPPIRAHAAGVASTAPRKNYAKQAEALFNDFLSRWRYVHDPLGTEWISGGGQSSWDVVYGAAASPGHYGVGDCDDATAALGAAYMSIGIPVRIATSSRPGSNQLFNHVYPEIYLSGAWIPADPVLAPYGTIGDRAPAERLAIWNLNGDLISLHGKFSLNQKKLLTKKNILRGADMNNQDLGLDRIGFAGDMDEEPAEWTNIGLSYFGLHGDEMGYIADASTLPMEYDDSDTIGDTDLIRTKMLEMDPKTYRHVALFGVPEYGALALADDGDIYQWTGGDLQTGLGGFFKKLFKKVKSRVKKVFKKIKGVAQKVLKKIPGGKYLIKLHNKVKKIAMKLVRPLTKFVGKYAAKLAPIAAIIPGYGPAIAAVLYTGGEIAKAMNETGVLQDPKTHKMIFKSGQQAAEFTRRIKDAANRAKATSRNISIPKNQRHRLIKTGTPAHMAVVSQLRKAA